MDVNKATKEHCVFCFDTLIAALLNGPLPDYPSNLIDFQAPLFVTWKTKDDNLRGCIGTFQSSNICTLLPKFALESALRDSRFPPISYKEVVNLKCAVSFLVNFEKGKDAYDWEIGKHGIIIKFKVDGNSYNGTFLPEVASEQKWDKNTTLQHLIRKTGYMKAWNDVVNQISLERYESSKCTINYEEYSQLKK